MRKKRTLLLVLASGIASSAVVLVWGWQRGLLVARHEHSSPCGTWARGLVVSNRLGEPRLEIVYSSMNWNYGLAWLQSSGRPKYWLGLGDFPLEEPANLHTRTSGQHR